MAWSIVGGGEAARWQPFMGSLGEFRAFLADLSPGDGILVIGTDSVCGHMADLARLSGRPAVFSTSAPNGGAPGGLSEYLEGGVSRRDSVRAFVRVSGTSADPDGNARGGRIDVLDRVGTTGWLPWQRETRICLAGMRVELLETPRAGLHIRVGVPVDCPVDADGFRTAAPRFVAVAKINGDGVLAVVPSDPVDPARRVGPDGSCGDARDDRQLRRSLTDFYGASPDEAERFLRGIGTELAAGVPRPARAAY